MSLLHNQAEKVAKCVVKIVELVVCRQVVIEKSNQVSEIILSHGVGARHPTDFHWNTEIFLNYGGELARLEIELASARYCAVTFVRQVARVQYRIPDPIVVDLVAHFLHIQAEAAATHCATVCSELPLDNEALQYNWSHIEHEWNSTRTAWILATLGYPTIAQE